MDLTLVYTIIGFALAGWSVIGNDSIQTLGTFIASKQKWFKWYTLAAAASFAMIVTIIKRKKLDQKPALLIVCTGISFLKNENISRTTNA